jgi:hypothetical protein
MPICDLCGEDAEETMQRVDWPGVPVSPGVIRSPCI